MRAISASPIRGRRELSLHRSRLLREVRRRADDHHRFDHRRRVGRQVQQDDAAAAEPDRLHAREAK